MKICLFLPSLNGGGAERVMLFLGEALIAAGYSVDIVLMKARGPYLSEIPRNVRVVDLNCPRLWTSVPRFINYLRDKRPDIIVSAMPLANGIACWASYLSRVPTRLIISEHNAVSIAFGDAEGLRDRVLQCLIRPVYCMADAIVAVSEGVADRVKRIPRVKEERVHVIYNPAYHSSFELKSEELIANEWLSDNMAPVILSAGRLVKQKDYITLIKAFSHLSSKRPARLIILGEGEERDNLTRLISKLDLNEFVSMPGFVANPWAWMARASVFVLSSRHEGFGNVLVEAMACGTAVVSTHCPAGPAEILEGGKYGPLTPVGDDFALAFAIEEMLDNPTPSSMLKARARQFSVEVAIEQYICLMRD